MQFSSLWHRLVFEFCPCMLYVTQNQWFQKLVFGRDQYADPCYHGYWFCSINKSMNCDIMELFVNIFAISWNLLSYFVYFDFSKWFLLPICPWYPLLYLLWETRQDLTAWSTNLLSTCCPTVTKRHNWHIDYLSVILLSWQDVLTRFVLKAVKFPSCICVIHTMFPNDLFNQKCLIFVRPSFPIKVMS